MMAIPTDTTFSNTNSQGNKPRPDLAHYRSIADYVPMFSDFVIWHRLLTVKYGIVNNYDPNTQLISIIFESTPRLLVTQREEEIIDNTYVVPLKALRNRERGTWYVVQKVKNNSIYYV